eukprot:3320815-Amphidinium_carterae.1
MAKGFCVLSTAHPSFSNPPCAPVRNGPLRTLRAFFISWRSGARPLWHCCHRLAPNHYTSDAHVASVGASQSERHQERQSSPHFRPHVLNDMRPSSYAMLAAHAWPAP